MTTSRRIFSSYIMNIAESTFQDVYNAVKNDRDFSESAMLEQYNSSMSNRPLKKGQSL